jgi:hypothetical protein
MEFRMDDGNYGSFILCRVDIKKTKRIALTFKEGK